MDVGGLYESRDLGRRSVEGAFLTVEFWRLLVSR